MKNFQKKFFKSLTPIQTLEPRQLLSANIEHKNDETLPLNPKDLPIINHVIINTLSNEIAEACVYYPLLCLLGTTLDILYNYITSGNTACTDYFNDSFTAVQNAINYLEPASIALSTTENITILLYDWTGLSTIETIIEECPKQPYACTAMMTGTFLSAYLYYKGSTYNIMANDWFTYTIQTHPEILTLFTHLNNPTTTPETKIIAQNLPIKSGFENTISSIHHSLNKTPQYLHISVNTVKTLKTDNQQQSLIDTIIYNINNTGLETVKTTIKKLNESLKSEQKTFLNSAFGEAQNQLKKQKTALPSPPSQTKLPVVKGETTTTHSGNLAAIISQTIAHFWILKAEWELVKFIENTTAQLLEKQSITELSFDYDWLLNDLFLPSLSFQTLLRAENTANNTGPTKAVYEIAGNNFDTICSLIENVVYYFNNQQLILIIDKIPSKIHQTPFFVIDFINAINQIAKTNNPVIIKMDPCHLQSLLTLKQLYTKHITQTPEAAVCTNIFQTLTEAIKTTNQNFPLTPPYSRVECLNKFPAHILNELIERNAIEIDILAKTHQMPKNKIEINIAETSDALWNAGWKNFTTPISKN
jgi:hypothetical protein